MIPINRSVSVVEAFTAGGRCAICQHVLVLNPPTSPHRLCIDHDHTTGDVRGFLCRSCNMGIGLFYDRQDLLLAAADYLRQHHARPRPLPEDPPPNALSARALLGLELLRDMSYTEDTQRAAVMAEKLGHTPNACRIYISRLRSKHRIPLSTGPKKG